MKKVLIKDFDEKNYFEWLGKDQDCKKARLTYLAFVEKNEDAKKVLEELETKKIVEEEVVIDTFEESTKRDYEKIISIIKTIADIAGCKEECLKGLLEQSEIAGKTANGRGVVLMGTMQSLKKVVEVFCDCVEAASITTELMDFLKKKSEKKGEENK